MIRLFRLTISEFVYSWLPVHKRTPVRVQFFTRLMQPLAVLAGEWISYRDRSVTRAQVTGETLSVQWYLNRLYDPIDRGITIVTSPLAGLVAGYRSSQAASYAVAGYRDTQPTQFAVSGLFGQSIYGTGSFAVLVPSAVLATYGEQIAATVRQYKLGGKQFMVISI